MERWRILLALAVLVILIVVGGLTVSGGRSGPSYNGRSLASWLEDFGPRPIGGGLIHDKLSNARRQPRRGLPGIAIRAMGTNAIKPLLLQIKRNDDPSWLASVKTALSKQRFLNLWLRDPQTLREQAAMAFYELGPAGISVQSELATLLTNYSSAACAAHALAGMGPSAIPAFVAALTNSSTWISDCGVWGLAQIGTESRSAVPQILALLQKGNTADMRLTLWALGEIHEPGEVICPELVRLLGYSDPIVRNSAAEALQKFGADAKPTLNEIKAALETETDPKVRGTLQELIEQVERDGKK